MMLVFKNKNKKRVARSQSQKPRKIDKYLFYSKTRFIHNIEQGWPTLL